MLMFLRLVQSLVRTLHSDGSPAQVAAGLTLGAALGLTPLLNPHNLIIVSAIFLLNVSFGGAVLVGPEPFGACTRSRRPCFAIASEVPSS